MPEQGPDWFLVATEACGGGTLDLGYFMEVRGFIGEVAVENKLGGPTGSPRGRGTPRGVGHALHPRGWIGTLLAQLFYSGGFFWSKNNRHKVSGHLDSI